MEHIFNNIKISLIKNDIVRFEFSPNKEFSEEESLFAKYKKHCIDNLVFKEDKFISFEYKSLIFSFDKNNPLQTLKVFKDGRQIYRYHEIRNSGELPLPNKTPIIFPLMDSPRLLIIENNDYGFKKEYKLQNDVKDLYLLICDKDHLKLRKQFIQLTGQNDIPNIKNFGLFSSRYYAYSQKSASDMILTYKKHGLPLDSFIMDTDWRNSEDFFGCGYSVNESLFPNIKDFYHFAHQNNVQVIMNDHPLPLNKKSSPLDEKEYKNRKENLQGFYAKGLDGWWYDRNWSSKLNTPTKYITSEALGNYSYYEISKEFNLGFVLDPEVYNRPIILSNIDNIHNGIYSGISDSRSHTYSLQWSGDIPSTEDSLRNEIINLKKCSNNMISYYSSDIGGHIGDPNKNQYIRWFEYGAFSPTLRPHCTNNNKKYREPWNYDKKTLETCKNYVYMRYKLLNVFYTAAFKNVDNGLGICSAPYLYYPNDKKCYKDETTYMLGDSILVSPIINSSKPQSLTYKNFVNKLKLTIYLNDEFKGPKLFTKNVKSFEDINNFFNDVKRENPKVKHFSFRYKGNLRLKHDYMLKIRNESITKLSLDNKVIFDDRNYHYFGDKELLKLKKNKTYKLVLDTIQDKKLKVLDLMIYKIHHSMANKIYLPEGEWFNMFHRNVYQGKRYIKEKYKIDETPVFVKAGSLLALYKTVDNISKMSLKNIVYDYYTSKNVDKKDYFYEDDGVTTGYKVGIYRKNPYHLYFKDNEYHIDLKKSENNNDDSIKIRNVIFKAHIRDNETIEKVFVNNEEIRFKRHDHKKTAIPFVDNEFSRDSKTLVFKFKQNIKEDYSIRLVIK